MMPADRTAASEDRTRPHAGMVRKGSRIIHRLLQVMPYELRSKHAELCSVAAEWLRVADMIAPEPPAEHERAPRGAFACYAIYIRWRSRPFVEVPWQFFAPIGEHLPQAEARERALKAVRFLREALPHAVAIYGREVRSGLLLLEDGRSPVEEGE